MTAIKWKKLISLLIALMVLSGSALADGLQITLDGEAVDSLALNVGDTVQLGGRDAPYTQLHLRCDCAYL